MPKQQILLIEDDSNIMDVMKLSLELEGFKVFEAKNGREGLDLLNDGLRPNLIILDLMMPVMNGWEFLEAIRPDKKLSEIPIVVASAFSDKTANLKHSPFLEKPIELAALLDTVKKYIRD